MWSAISIAARIAYMLLKQRRGMRFLTNKWERKRAAESAVEEVAREAKHYEDWANRTWR